MMNEEQHLKAKALIKKYLNAECSEEEKAWVERWYLRLNHKPNDLSDQEIESDLRELQFRLSEIPGKRVRLRTYFHAAAAAALLVLTAGLLWQHHSGNKNQHEAAVTAEDILPGRNRATLSLDGTRGIVLSENQKSLITKGNTISYEDGTALQKTEKIQMATVTTPVAGQYEVVLPDGTHAWLNAQSSITYPTQFMDKNRKISISGEVYLEVAKDRKRPFIVQTGQQQIEVLGTSFNINAYGDNRQTITTLAEGSLRVTNDQSKNSAILAPGQQAVVSDSKNIEVTAVDTDEASSWKNGLFIINNEPLANYARQIERWYDVVVDMQMAGSTRLSAIIPRNAKLSEVLQAIELKTGVKFKTQGRRVMAIE